MKIPVIRGHIGDWRYYTGVMKFSEISKLVTPSVDEFCKPSCLNDLLQRQLTDNYLAIKNYILTDKQRFFNAIVLAIYDGDPKWLEIEFGDEYEVYDNVGFLELNENAVRIFPVDGQHRVKGIVEAISKDSSIADEEVTVIIIAHKNDAVGKRRTRKLFSTLNRRAKPVGDNYQIALDEDDLVAIVTREIVEEIVLFQNERLVNHKTKQIPNGNKNAFTSLVALYQCNEYLIQAYLGMKEKEFKAYKLCRPEESVIENTVDYIRDYWNALILYSVALQEYLNIEIDAAANYRNKDGGNVLFRPIGVIEFVKASILLSKRNEITINEAIRRLNVIPMELSDEVWKGVMWDGKKIINRVNLNLIKFLMLYLESKENLTAQEIEKMTDAYSTAINFEGKEEEILSIIDGFNKNKC